MFASPTGSLSQPPQVASEATTIALKFGAPDELRELHRIMTADATSGIDGDDGALTGLGEWRP